MIKAKIQSIRKTPPTYVNLILSVTRGGVVLQADNELYDLIGFNKEQFETDFQSNLIHFVKEDQKEAFCKALQTYRRALFECNSLMNNAKTDWLLLIGYPCEGLKEEDSIYATLLNLNSERLINHYLSQRETVGAREAIDEELFEEIMIQEIENNLPSKEKSYKCDRITGLPNELLFFEVAKKIMKREPEKKYAIVYTDINYFGFVNKMYGYLEGNRLLAYFAAMMKRERNVVKEATRLSADNFVFLITYDTEDAVTEQICTLNEEFSNQCYQERIGVKLILSSGVALLEEDTPIRSAIDNANIARKSVKGNPLITSCGLFTNEMQQKIQWETYVNQHMEAALNNKEFSVYYQPKISLETECIVGAEALVRWIVADGEVISPIRFIPIFEMNGFIERVDFFVYEEVCRFLKERLDQKQKVVPISVNVSGSHLTNPYFVQNVISLVKRYEIPTHLIELELTESVCIENSKVAIDMVKQFRENGFLVSIDDFGSGFSSLNLLKDMETDIIKLDRQFFREGEMHKEEQIIITSIVNMAKKLNMKVISEGVETRAQSEFLKGIMCDMAQGYFFAKPMPLDSFEAELLQNT